MNLLKAFVQNFLDQAPPLSDKHEAYLQSILDGGDCVDEIDKEIADEFEGFLI